MNFTTSTVERCINGDTEIPHQHVNMTLQEEELRVKFSFFDDPPDSR